MTDNNEKKTMLMFNVNKRSGQQPHDIQETTAEINNESSKSMDGNETTLLHTSPIKTQGKSEPVIKPKGLRGWLVVINGSEKGRVFRLTKDRAYIGRNEDYDIPLMQDKAVSRRKCACLEWDASLNSHWYDSIHHDIQVYHNKKVLKKKIELGSHEIITVGVTEMLYIPF